MQTIKGGTDNSVRVSATLTRALPFSSLFLNQPVTIVARAQAAFAEGTIHRACLMTLKKDGTTFTIGNGATVIANCGMMALSCDPDEPSVKVGDNATIDVNEITVCREAEVPSSLENKVTVDPGLANYDYEVAVPDPSSDDTDESYACTGKGKNKAASLQPGVYNDGIVVKCDTTFAPGIYFVKGELDLTHNAFVVGHKVMFVLMEGAQLKLGGSGANDNTGTGGNNIKSSLYLDPPTASDLIDMGYSEDFANTYENYLILAKKTEEPVDHKINGNVSMHLQGKMYLPKGNVKITGNSEAADGLCFQIASYTIDVNGSAYLKTLCDQDETTSLSTTAGVRLVA
ncbi:MAG: pilus assembly protein [Caenibius sp.]